MALVFCAATVLGGAYGTCQALAQHEAAVNGTAAGSILSLCNAASWSKFDASERAFALELAAHAALTSILLLVRPFLCRHCL